MHQGIANEIHFTALRRRDALFLRLPSIISIVPSIARFRAFQPAIRTFYRSFHVANHRVQLEPFLLPLLLAPFKGRRAPGF